MGRRRSFDIEEAVDTATRLFWRGYEKTSLADLTEAMGIAPNSFYFAFGSKETLFRHVVHRYMAARDDAFDRAFQAPTTAEGVAALLRGYVEVVTDPAHTPGCLLVNNSPSMDGDDALRRWLADIREALRQRLWDRFAADRTRGILAADFDPEAMSRYVVTLAGGLAVEAQSGASRDELHAVITYALRGFAPDVTDAFQDKT